MEEINMLNRPNLGIFINSIRDIGYSCETAVADLVDNCISAKASHVHIFGLPSLNCMAIADDGSGMNSSELIEAMRLGTNHTTRSERDLGRFGLGLKTASFSQCRKLTVATRKNGTFSSFRWDLDSLEKRNDWIMDEVTENEVKKDLARIYTDLLEFLESNDNCTIVLWQKMDRYDEAQFTSILGNVKKHIALVFHKYLSRLGFQGQQVEIYLNKSRIKPFDPFESCDKIANRSSQSSKTQNHVLSSGKKMTITTHVLPPLSKLSKSEYDELGTSEGFTKSQGFYLYRQGRLLVYGTWFGLAKISDASNLVRIEVSIDNNQDDLWNIDVKKSRVFRVFVGQ